MDKRLARTLKAQKGLQFEIKSIDQLDNFNKQFDQATSGMSESKKRKFQAAKEEMESIVRSGGSFKVYNDGTFDTVGGDYGLTKGAVEPGGRLLNRRGKNKESLLIGMMANMSQGNPDFFKGSSGETSNDKQDSSDIEVETYQQETEDMKKDKDELDTILKDVEGTEIDSSGTLEAWRKVYEKETGRTWEDLVSSGSAMDRRGFSKGFYDFLKEKGVSDEGWDYGQVGSKYFSDDRYTSDSSWRGPISASYRALKLPWTTGGSGSKQPTLSQAQIDGRRAMDEYEPPLTAKNIVGPWQKVVEHEVSQLPPMEEGSKPKSEDLSQRASKIKALEQELSEVKNKLSSRGEAQKATSNLRSILLNRKSILEKQISKLRSAVGNAGGFLYRKGGVIKAFDGTALSLIGQSLNKTLPPNLEEVNVEDKAEAFNTVGLPSLSQGVKGQDLLSNAPKTLSKVMPQTIATGTQKARGINTNQGSGNMRYKQTSTPKRYKQRTKSGDGSGMGGSYSIGDALNSGGSRALATSILNRALSKQADVANPYAFDPSMPVGSVKGLKQSTKDTVSKQNSALMRSAGKARSSDPTMNLITKAQAQAQVSDNQARMAELDEQAIDQSKAGVLQRIGENRRNIAENTARRIQFRNQLNKDITQAEVERDKSTLQPFMSKWKADEQRGKQLSTAMATFDKQISGQNLDKSLSNLQSYTNQEYQKALTAINADRKAKGESELTMRDYDQLSKDPRFNKITQFYNERKSKLGDFANQYARQSLKGAMSYRPVGQMQIFTNKDYAQDFQAFQKGGKISKQSNQSNQSSDFKNHSSFKSLKGNHSLSTMIHK